MLRFKLILIVKKPLLKVVVHREKLTNTYSAKTTYATTHIVANKFLYQKLKKYLENLDIKDLSDNKKFWKAVKTHFSSKGLN